jgi:DNA-binding MarR family transcriptional regulator
MPASRLAAEERLQPQSLTRLIASLERAGWIARSRSAADRRAIEIALTPRGRRVLDGELRARRAWLARAITAALTPDERVQLVEATDVLLKLVAYGDAVDGSPPPSRRRGRG